MTPTPKRAESLPPADHAAEPLELLTSAADFVEPSFDEEQWREQAAEQRGAGGRQVLGTALTILAGLWLAYTAWSAGRTLAGQPLSSPQVAQWIAVAAGPLALMGLVWLMFGRTRRKEAERFTRSVISMRSEARSLEALLEVLSQRIQDSRSELTMISKHLMQLGDDTTGKLGGITREFDSSSEKLKRHGEALDRAAEAARNDIAVLLDDLPRAEQTARAVAEQIRSVGAESAGKAALFERHVGDLAERTQSADRLVAEATDRLAARLAEIESAGSLAAARVGEAEAAYSGALDALLERTSATLDQIRSGIDIQAAAVAALVDQAAAGIGRAGADASESLAANIDHASNSLEGLSGRVAEQDRASQHMIAEIDRGLAMIDQRFTELAANGDERANRFLESLTRARLELDTLASQAGSQDDAIGSLAERTAALRDSIGRLATEIRENVGIAIGEAQGSADRLTNAAAAARPEVAWLRDATLEASEKLSATGAEIAQQRERFGALLSSVDDGVEDAQSKLAQLASTLAQVEREATSLSSETGPALIASLVQVKEAAAHAADRAREAIQSVIPEASDKLSEEAAQALERVIRESVEDRLRDVEQVAARAVESARAASDRLTHQMITLGQTASALEAHIEQTSKEQREKDSEAFAKRVALLIDSMHSAAIDVGKILSDEFDDKAWGAYLKGNRGVFTSRAVRLISGSETRAIRAHYEEDAEFQRSVNRYVHDFEAMLRRVLAERDGGMIAVTFMSSDMGKLYAALAQAIDKRR
jgi:predicted  nucleic acid-binding Zn-ribbon protein